MGAGQVLLMTIQNPPPTLEQDSGSKHFSKHMRDMVQLCLNKDPSKRPTAAKLLEHKFFKVPATHFTRPFEMNTCMKVSVDRKLLQRRLIWPGGWRFFVTCRSLCLDANWAVRWVQTAGDRVRLVKGLLAGMPPVTKRVEEMRAGRAPGLQAKQAQVQVEESQVCLRPGRPVMPADSVPAVPGISRHAPSLCHCPHLL